jgi:hypothetical protein
VRGLFYLLVAKQKAEVEVEEEEKQDIAMFIGEGN